MDLSALIFVALAAAWAVYLVPKALKAHETDAVTRSVDNFSERMRVLARRDAVSADRSSLVVGDGSSTGEVAAVVSEEAAADAAPAAVAPASTPVQRRLRHAAAKRAAQRRRRVLGAITLMLAVVLALAVAGVVAWPYLAIPITLLVAWLVACRLTVKRERATRAPKRAKKVRTTLADQEIAAEDAAIAAEPGTEEIEAVVEAADQKAGWDPVPITLPTYVAKAPAGRTVRTIDLDATGVWSSGRNAADSKLARDSQQADKASASDEQRATGS